MQRYLSQNESFHRHLVVPLDSDLRDAGPLWEAARLWNCDWVAVSRLDRTRRHGKLLDLQYRAQLPFSVCAAGPWPERRPFLARPESLAGLLAGEQGRQLAAAAQA
jgi:flagellar biosynthesis GTPase FlhF